MPIFKVYASSSNKTSANRLGTADIHGSVYHQPAVSEAGYCKPGRLAQAAAAEIGARFQFADFPKPLASPVEINRSPTPRRTYLYGISAAK